MSQELVGSVLSTSLFFIVGYHRDGETEARRLIIWIGIYTYIPKNPEGCAGREREVGKPRLSSSSLSQQPFEQKKRQQLLLASYPGSESCFLRLYNAKKIALSHALYRSTPTAAFWNNQNVYR